MVKSPTKDLILHTCIIIIAGLLLIFGYSMTYGPGTDIYQHYANVFWPHVDAGSSSESKLPAEYPFLSLVPMLLSLVAGNAFYSSSFIFIIFVAIFGIYLLLFYTVSRTAALSYMIYIIIGGFCIIIGRLDI